jgi:hypothetical protein
MTCLYLPESHMHLQPRGSREGFDETLVNWVIDDSGHNRDRFRLTMRCSCRRRRANDNHVRLQLDQLVRQSRCWGGISIIHRSSMCRSMPSDQPSSRKLWTKAAGHDRASGSASVRRSEGRSGASARPTVLPRQPATLSRRTPAIASVIPCCFVHTLSRPGLRGNRPSPRSFSQRERGSRPTLLTCALHKVGRVAGVLRT